MQVFTLASNNAILLHLLKNAVQMNNILNSKDATFTIVTHLQVSGDTLW